MLWRQELGDFFVDEAGFCNIFGSRNAPKTLTLEKEKGSLQKGFLERERRERKRFLFCGEC